MSNYNLGNYLPYKAGQVVFVLVGSTITQGLCHAYHVAGNSFTYDVSFPPSTSTTNYPQSQVFNTLSNAQIALQLATSPTPTLSPTHTPTPSVTRSITPTPSLTPSYTGPQYGSNLLSGVSFTAAGGTVSDSGNNYVFTSNGGSPCSISTTLTGIVGYKLYQLSIRFEQMTGKNALITLTAPSSQIIQKLFTGNHVYPPINAFQNSGTGVLTARLDGSGLLETTFAVVAGSTLDVEVDFYDDSNFKSVMANGKKYGLTLTLIEVLPDISLTPTPSATISVSPTPSATPTISVTPSVTATISHTPTATVTVTPTISVSPSVTPTHTPTISVTPSITASITVTPSVTPTHTITPSVTPSPT